MHGHGENIIMCGWIEAPCMTNECMCIASRCASVFIIIITAELILEANVSYLWLAQVTFAIVWKTRTSFDSSPTSLTRRGEEEAFEDMLDLEGHLSLQHTEEDLVEGEVGKRAWHTAQLTRLL